MRFLLSLAFIATLAGSSTAQKRQGELFLDLLTIPPPPERHEQSTGKGCGSATGRSSHSKPSVQVTLATLDQENLTPGAEVVFEVLVENVSDTPIDLATSRDQGLVSTCHMSDEDVRTSSAVVSRTKGKLNGLVAVGFGLYGSRQVPGTTMTLDPGERLRVRVPATVTLHGSHWALTDTPQTVEVAAMFMFQRGHRSGAELSLNRRTVQLSRPQPTDR